MLQAERDDYNLTTKNGLATSRTSVRHLWWRSWRLSQERTRRIGGSSGRQRCFDQAPCDPEDEVVPANILECMLHSSWQAVDWKNYVSSAHAEIPEDEEELKKDEENWEKLIGDLTKPVEMDTIYMVYPVRSRRGRRHHVGGPRISPEVKVAGVTCGSPSLGQGVRVCFQGIAKVVAGQRHPSYKVSGACTSDQWCCGTRGTMVQDDGQGSHGGSEVGLKFWTLAMQHAANRRMYERLGLEKPRLWKFGSKVMIRRKVFGNNKKYDLTDRWEEGTYLGLSDTIKGGAVVLRPGGVITETLNLKLDVVDPHLLLAEPQEDDGGGVGDVGVEQMPVVDLPEPARRLTEKTTPPAIRMLSTREHHELHQRRAPSGWTMRSIIQQQEGAGEVLV